MAFRNLTYQCLSCGTCLSHVLKLYEIVNTTATHKLTVDWNVKMQFYRYRNSHGEDKTPLRPPYLHNGLSNAGKTASLYQIEALYILFAHGFAAVCLVIVTGLFFYGWVISQLYIEVKYGCAQFTHVVQGCFIGSGALQPRRKWVKSTWNRPQNNNAWTMFMILLCIFCGCFW